MPRIASTKVVRHEFENGEYIEYREQLSFAELEPIMTGLDAKNEIANIKMAIPLLELAVSGWHLVDGEGAEIPFAKEKVKELDSNTVLALFTEMVTRYFPEKKSSNTSAS